MTQTCPQCRRPLIAVPNTPETWWCWYDDRYYVETTAAERPFWTLRPCREPAPESGVQPPVANPPPPAAPALGDDAPIRAASAAAAWLRFASPRRPLFEDTP